MTPSSDPLTRSSSASSFSMFTLPTNNNINYAGSQQDKQIPESSKKREALKLEIRPGPSTRLINKLSPPIEYQATSTNINNQLQENRGTSREINSVILSQNLSIAEDSKDIDLLKEVLHRGPSSEECKSILERSTAMRSFISDLRRLRMKFRACLGLSAFTLLCIFVFEYRATSQRDIETFVYNFFVGAPFLLGFFGTALLERIDIKYTIENINNHEKYV